MNFGKKVSLRRIIVPLADEISVVAEGVSAAMRKIFSLDDLTEAISYNEQWALYLLTFYEYPTSSPGLCLQPSRSRFIFWANLVK